MQWLEAVGDMQGRGSLLAQHPPQSSWPGMQVSSGWVAVCLFSFIFSQLLNYRAHWDLSYGDWSKKPIPWDGYCVMVGLILTMKRGGDHIGNSMEQGALGPLNCVQLPPSALSLHTWSNPRLCNLPLSEVSQGQPWSSPLAWIWQEKYVAAQGMLEGLYHSLK